MTASPFLWCTPILVHESWVRTAREGPRSAEASDTRVLLTKNYSEIILFVKITNFTRNSLKKSLFPQEDFESAQRLKTTKNDYQGIIFVVISCQKVKVSGKNCRKSLQSTQQIKDHPPPPIKTVHMA